MSADYSDAAAAAVAPSPGRTHSPSHQGPAARGKRVSEQAGGESKVQIPRLLCWIEPKISGVCAVCYCTILFTGDNLLAYLHLGRLPSPSVSSESQSKAGRESGPIWYNTHAKQSKL